MQKVLKLTAIATTIAIGLGGGLLTSSHVSAAQFNAKVTQKTVHGRIKGVKDTKNKVIQWLGIPYAQAPKGDLRWKAPKEMTDWDKTLDATKAGASFIQLSNGKVTGSEDALNLDIVRPDNTKKDLPVMVYIHGGNNQTGTAQEIKGNTFANDLNTVYVSVNYRLGALGFNPLTALKTGSAEENSGNYSLLDIAAALDWVKANIETFGGDKDNVTLAGFSAGGRDVMASLISPIFKDKYDKAISFSGGMTLADETESQDIFASAIAPLVVEDGVKTTEEEAKPWLLTDGSDVHDYLYGLSAERLAALMGNAGIRMSVFLHLYKDGTVIPKDGFEGATYNDVPLMLMTGTSEFSMFAAYDNRFVTDFSSGNLFKDKDKLAQFTYAKTYGSQLYRLSNTVDSARQMADSYQSPIYIGEISYGDKTSSLGKTLGVFHGIFEPMLQKPSNYKAFIGKDFETSGAKEMSTEVKTYLKNFLAKGNPNGRELTKWQKWSDQSPVLSITASKKKANITATTDTETAADILAKMNADKTLSDEVKSDLNQTVLNGRWFSKPIDDRQ